MPGDLTTWLTAILDEPTLSGMGHAQRRDDLNLGLGWIYYGLARLLRPRRVVVIGSWRGFAPLVFGRALADNLEGGRVTFIDPSLVDDFWRDPRRVIAHFAAHGLDNVDHYCLTTQEFVASSHWAGLGEVGIVLVDGYHSEAQARFDHTVFLPLLATDGYVLFHDSVRERPSCIYGPEQTYRHTVKRYMDSLRREGGWEVLELPFGDGLCIVRRTGLRS